MKRFNYAINIDGSTLSYEAVAALFLNNFKTISSVCGLTFDEITQTDERKRAYPLKLIKFSDGSNFKSINMAVARAGVDFNIGKTAGKSPEWLRRLALHETGHNFGLKHTQIIESVMSVNRFRHPRGKSLLWRKDLIDLHNIAPSNPKPVALISVDEDFDVMIPSIVIGGVEMSVRLRYYPIGKFWMPSRVYSANDGVDMEERAKLMAGDILELSDVSFMGVNIGTVKMRLYKDGQYWKFELVAP
ncbi:MAG: hypothetical protein COA78_07065 [Blastopirellula sp.]|nr:MAG: hypothetical protein COA78_07065 [Blastopirellula sp.]